MVVAARGSLRLRFSRFNCTGAACFACPHLLVILLWPRVIANRSADGDALCYYFDDRARYRRMTPGPTQIIECPACGALHQLATAASGNTFGALLWSDGKLDAPMLFNSPDIARCSGCRVLFMLELANVVGELPAFHC